MGDRPGVGDRFLKSQCRSVDDLSLVKAVEQIVIPDTKLPDNRLRAEIGPGGVVLVQRMNGDAFSTRSGRLG